MRKRLIQICGFLISSLGWLFVLCTLAMDYWRITQLGGQGGSFIIKVAWYWSNLWKDCFTESTAVTNCRDYPDLWSVTYYIHAVRGLIMCGLTLGFFAVMCCFLGMECTYIGGAEKTKDKLVFGGAVLHFAGGVSDIAAYCLYINRIIRNAFATGLPPGELRYDFGPPIFLGLIGSIFIMFGAVLYVVTVNSVMCPARNVVQDYSGGTYVAPGSGRRTLYTGFNPSKLYRTSVGSGQSSKISRLSQTPQTRLSERDAFV
ncbi:claudin-7-like [Xenentodon cancila]